MASRPSPRGRAVRPVQLVAMMIAFLLIAIAGGLLTAGLLLPAVGSVGAVGNATTDLFDDLPTELEIDEPSEQSVMLDADGNVLATFFAENRIVVGFDEISQHMKDAVVAVEDHRFYEHGGVDPDGILRATVRNITGGDLEGASTLTQQYVKNVQIEESRVLNDPELYQAATETTIARKLREARLAIALEQVRTKDEILTGYLNIAQFGPSQWGVEAAAHHYFNKSAADLSIAESAMLAGITQSPARWDPVTNPENAQQRRNTVLGTMLREGFISRAEYDEAVAIPIADMLDVQEAPRGCGVAGNAAYFCQYVVNEILLNDAYGETVEDRRQLLNRGGLTIHTTLDPAKQQAAFDALVGSVPVDDPSGISMALSSIEPGTGRIYAMAQNTRYGVASEADPRATQVNYNVGQSHGGGSGFQSGSTFKVFTLVQWLRDGHSLMERVNSANRFFPRRDWTISCAPEYADNYEPKNLEGFGGGSETVLESTRTSINTSFVVMAQQMDLCAITGIAADMGVETGSGEPLQNNPAMILGSNTVTPLSMANAYATLAAGGIACEPVAITRMQDRNGEEITVPPSDCKRVLEEDVANAANYALQSVMGPEWDSTGSTARIPPRPSAGKTGTANEDMHAWFIGYVPQMSTAVWMGHSDRDEQMGYEVINGQWRNRVYGGLIAAPTWKAYMLRATEGMPIENFAPASPRAVQGERLRVPSIGGQTVEQAQQTLEAAGFTVRIGDAVDSGWPVGLAVATTPEAGSQAPAGSTVTIYTSGGRQSEAGEDPAGGGDGEDAGANPSGDDPGNSGENPGNGGNPGEGRGRGGDDD
ncbi:penicillin-binding protein [Georgenia wutianyii]|uniref:Penicillin-binding protein n=1 Tax=Georgenia wutianyii TaxID=2585135 RepID=A0ABX5VJ54_9MICO|nr:transglycosylase domain-containing protein [Georgenia wutianyii]QDB78093.1 penicillin-binding protein [Georgenia wutianyii]